MYKTEKFYIWDCFLEQNAVRGESLTACFTMSNETQSEAYQGTHLFLLGAVPYLHS